MKKPRLEAIIALLVAIISLLAVINSVFIYWRDNCVDEIMLIDANNTEFFFRVSQFSNVYTTKYFMDDALNKTHNGTDSLANTFNVLQKATWDYRSGLQSKINTCSRYSVWINVLHTVQIILSGVVIILVINLLKKTRN
ncbi:MAG: hypothetical protein MSIBF_03525 [Candidatus Altiarchaeales archaeon IMC4]|nr:MAG: hypothetical protein MSIBF_03525 [Candidatus Altiarchaeales archaeon IMC4]